MQRSMVMTRVPYYRVRPFTSFIGDGWDGVRFPQADSSTDFAETSVELERVGVLRTLVQKKEPVEDAISPFF